MTPAQGWCIFDNKPQIAGSELFGVSVGFETWGTFFVFLFASDHVWARLLPRALSSLRILAHFPKYSSRGPVTKVDHYLTDISPHALTPSVARKPDDIHS